MRDSMSFASARAGFPPAGFGDEADVAECALDEQIEQLQRHFAAATRAAARAKFELELLEQRPDIQAHTLEQARRQRAAAETRCAQLLKTIDALEERLESRFADEDL